MHEQAIPHNARITEKKLENSEPSVPWGCIVDEPFDLVRLSFYERPFQKFVKQPSALEKNALKKRTNGRLWRKCCLNDPKCLDSLGTCLPEISVPVTSL